MSVPSWLPRTRRTVSLALSVLIGTLGIAHPLTAQDRLAGLRTVTAGAVLEQVRFGGDGLLQAPLLGNDSIRVRRASQRSLPLSATWTLGPRWLVDLTAVHTSGEVTYTGRDGGPERKATLAGPSDVRLRVTGRFLDDALVLTAGANAPTGSTALDASELTALRVLASPALAMGTPAVGAGLSGTLGLLTQRRMGAWVLAGGAAIEWRGDFQPVASLVAGAPLLDLRPGNALRLSASLDGPLGRHRLAITASGDFFASDELRSPTQVGGSSAPLATVTLGPVMGADAQLQLVGARGGDVVLWTSARYRAGFARNGLTVSGSDGVYVDGGVRARQPLARRTDLVMALDGRFHTGLALDQGLATSGVAGGTGTIGVAHRVGGVSLQPFVRASGAALRARGPSPGRPRTNVSGVTGGFVILTRF